MCKYSIWLRLVKPVRAIDRQYRGRLTFAINKIRSSEINNYKLQLSSRLSTLIDKLYNYRECNVIYHDSDAGKLSHPDCWSRQLYRMTQFDKPNQIQLINYQINRRYIVHFPYNEHEINIPQLHNYINDFINYYRQLSRIKFNRVAEALVDTFAIASPPHPLLIFGSQFDSEM